MVSVIIPTYNRARTIGRAVQSVLEQSGVVGEVIVVDDGSTDDTAAVLAEIACSLLRVIRCEANRGAQAARNAGIEAARGEWLAFLDSDDYWLPGSLALRLTEAESSCVAVVHSAGLLGEAGGALRPIPWLPPLRGRIYPELLCEPGPMFQGLLVRKVVLAAIGPLDEEVRAFQEWDTVIRLARHCEFGYVAAPTFVYDCSGADTISKNLRRDADGYAHVVEKHRAEIVRVCGHAVLARHWRIVAAKYRHIGQRRLALRCAIRSWWVCCRGKFSAAHRPDHRPDSSRQEKI